MTTFALSADIRAKNEKASEIRQSKKVPGIVYGKSQEPISVIVDASEFLKLYRKAGESNIVQLTVGKKDIEVLIHDVQSHPITGSHTHVDFYAITRGQKVHTHIHLNFIGDAPAKKEGAIIEEYIKEVEVKCLPRNLVDHFDVNLASLKQEGDVIRIADLGIDTEKYEILDEAEAVVATASLPRSAVSDEAEASEASEETK